MKATIVFEKIWNAIHEEQDGERRYRYIILTGSSRSSKTYSILQALHLYAIQNKKKRISSWRETKKICNDTVLHDYRRAITSFPNWTDINYNITKSIHTFPSGSTYEMCGGDDDVLIHGFAGDVAHFNEPYNMSKDTFDQIDMRTSDFVLIDWNPRQSHWIEDLAKNPRSIVIHSTFRDNPFVPKEQRLKILSYDPSNEINVINGTANEWKWQVYGLGLKAEKPNRVFHWKKCTKLEYDNISTPEIIGIDWGKVDPFGIVGVKYHDGRLFVHEYNYDSEDVIRAKLTPEMVKNVMSADGEHGIVSYVFNKLKIDKKQLLICDTNRPEKGALLRRKGYNIIPATKGKGSILDGVEILQSLEVFYTEDSKNIEIEQENYEIKVDKFGDQLEEMIDEFNHCFIGSTLITTINGQIPIKDVKEGDLVLTSKGYKKVLKKFNNGKKQVSKHLMQFDTNLVYLCSTKEHKIKTVNGWTQIQNLKKGNVLYQHKNLMEKLTTYTKGSDIFQEGQKDYTERCGNFIKEKYQKDMIFTTSTETNKITELKISIWSLNHCIYDILVKNGLKKILSGLKNFMLKVLRKPKNGINQKRVLNGIEKQLLTRDLETENTEKENALFATNNLQQTQKDKNSAITTVNQNGEEIKDLTTLKENVLNVNQFSSQISIQKSKLVDVKVLNQWNEEVFDLMVEDVHEYFANGVLVHNCIDPIRYVAIHLRNKGVIKVL